MKRMRASCRSLLVVSSIALIGALRAAPAGAATFVVNSTGDTPDAAPGDGVCADASGDCTLRAAIREANATLIVSTIEFAIGGPGVKLKGLKSVGESSNEPAPSAGHS